MKKRLGNWRTTTVSLAEELKTLKNRVDHLKAQESDNLTAADNEVIQPGKKRKREFEFWLTNVESKKTEYSHIENELREQGPSKSLKSRIEREIKQVEELIRQGKFPNGVVLEDHASRRLPMVTTSLVGQRCAEYVETILKLLKEDGVFAIGVHGMGGVGKTSIVKEIHNHLLSDPNIAGKAVYWVTASQNCSLENLQNDIGKAVGLHDFSKEDNERKKALLFQRFSKLGNSVLIIDDLWDSYVMEKIGIPRGCKVVITTRNLEVCRRMQCQHIIRIVPLNEADSWTLFVAKLEEELPRDVEDIAVKIVEECGGLPLALITMGCCMRGIADVWEWENALYELRKPARRQDLMEAEVFRILKFSFDRLNDHKMQNCFLSCLLFPEDRKIEEAGLVDLWINEGLLDDIETQQDRVNKGHVILNRLVNACLLERGGGDSLDRRVKMHDLIRDMGIIITREHPLFIAEAGKHLKQLPEEEKWSKDLEKVSLSYNKIEKIPMAMAPIMTPNLTVLMLNWNPLKEIPDSFFVHMRALRHLDLSGTKIERVPESVSDLENLRGLLLGGCWELRYLPSVAKLTKLRVFDLDGCYEVKRAPRGLDRLKSVEKLRYVPWDVSDLIGFNEVVRCLTSLSCFRFCIFDPTMGELPFGKEFYDSDKVIWVCGGQYGGNNNSIIVVPATVECLGIRKSEMMKGASLGDVFHPLGEAKGLKRIHIKDCRGLEYISGSSGTQQGYSLLCNARLERLELKSLPDLRSIAKLGVPDCFTQLTGLDIRGCPKLKKVVPVSRTKKLLFPNLETIRVYNCVEVMEIFETIEEAVLSLPNLKQLILANLPKIKVIFPFTEEFHLPNLEMIKVSDCEKLEEIFGSNKASPSSNSILSLPNLHNLHLTCLPQLGSIYRGTCHCTLNPSKNIRTCPKLML